ncbi:hypothetical protein VTO73DRAFT_10368 [Trametes versicolor]
MRSVLIVLYVLCTAITTVAVARPYRSAVTSLRRRRRTSRHVPATRMCLPAHGPAPEACARTSPGCEDVAGDADALSAHNAILSPWNKHAAEVQEVKQHSRNAAF